MLDNLRSHRTFFVILLSPLMLLAARNRSNVPQACGRVSTLASWRR